jgi:hypothetical protein
MIVKEFAHALLQDDLELNNLFLSSDEWPEVQRPRTHPLTAHGHTPRLPSDGHASPGGSFENKLV